MKFPYIKLPSLDSQLKWTARPYIPIRLIWLNKIWEGYALIDSGADRSLFNIQIAQDLGLNFDEEQFENFGGIEGGVLKARLHKIKVQIIGMSEEVEITAGFINSSGVVAILGQDGFFDAFRIKFERDHGIVEITPVKK